MNTLQQMNLFDFDPQPTVEEIPLPTGTKCDGCGASIIWQRTMHGKPTPLNPGVHYASPHGKGKRLFLVADDGSSVQGFECNQTDKGARAGRVSHFATCPKAKEFRK